MRCWRRAFHHEALRFLDNRYEGETMSTSISIQIDRVPPASVKWTVSTMTNKSALLVQFNVNGQRGASYLGKQNAFGASGVIEATGNVFFDGYAQGQEGTTVEMAKVQGVLEMNSNMILAADQV
jgi:hypothetical protein